MALFHKDIGFPADMKLPTAGVLKLQYTHHALQAAMDDRYGSITLPTELDISKAHPIEIEYDGKVRKCVYRAALDAKRDICIVFIPEGYTGRVKTVWVNLASDLHKTLDRSKYTVPAKKVFPKLPALR